MSPPIRTCSLALALLVLAALALPAQAADAPAAPAPAATAAPAAPAVAASPAAPTAVPTGPRVSAPTRAALETLLQALPPGTHDGVAREKVTARRGETLESVIRRTMGDSPFKEAFLRGAFLELNATAFQPGTTRLIAGAQLQVPHVGDLRDHLQRVLGPQPGAGHASSAPVDKRHWVRFP